ncbi:MAG: urea ABC transporter permease subunit UrtB [Usitatibacteraceae bacterium]
MRHVVESLCRAPRLLASAISICIALLTAPSPSWALNPEHVVKLATGENEEKIAAIGAMIADGDASVLPLLAALQEGNVQVSGKQILLIKGEEANDFITGKVVSPAPIEREEIVLNNRVRRELDSAVSALKLLAPERDVRLTAAKALQANAEESMLPLIRKALLIEKDAEIKALLTTIEATVQLGSTDRVARLAAVKALGGSTNPATKSLLLGVLEKKGDAYVEADGEIRIEAQNALKAVESRLATGERLGHVFSGISLGSILLLAALGLAITYGLMGVINMAHGELIMIGAYATYLVQNQFRAHLPFAFDWYLVAAVPVAFLAAALVGVLMERLVIRYLYGRPLETLLATWGISLLLIQSMRTLFGAQNVQVENPAWMSGGIALMGNLVLPWNRIIIIGFAFAVLVAVWLTLTRTRLGLFVRGVTQNRAMADCVGVPTSKVDTLAFALGSGIAGLAGCALSQIGNVGPDLGQTYIVDSFMVVVLGGVGQLAGTVVAGMGLGVANKFLEAWSGAVLAKIAVLAFIIIFIQKRPQGLFALKGRSVET